VHWEQPTQTLSPPSRGGSKVPAYPPRGSVLDLRHGLFFFFFFNQQFIMRCSNAVRGPIIQTVRTLRLRYALPVITQPNASGPPSGGQTQAEAHEYSKTASPFRAVKKSRPPPPGPAHTVASHRIALGRSPDRNPPQRAGQSPEGVELP
jgi:hypothetical protein